MSLGMYLVRLFGQVNLAEFQEPSTACAISAVVAVGFTIAQAITMRRQGMRIWDEESDLGVSIPWMSFNVFAFFNNILYGLSMPDISGILILNGLLFVLYFYIAVGLWKHGQVKSWHYWVVVLGISLALALLCSPEKERLYIMSGVVSAIFLGTQPLRLLFERKRGVLEIKFVLVGFCSTVFWIVYGFTLPELDVPIIVIASMIFLLLGATILLWLFWCRPTTPSPQR